MAKLVSQRTETGDVLVQVAVEPSGAMPVATVPVAEWQTIMVEGLALLTAEERFAVFNDPALNGG